VRNTYRCLNLKNVYKHFNVMNISLSLQCYKHKQTLHCDEHSHVVAIWKYISFRCNVIHISLRRILTDISKHCNEMNTSHFHIMMYTTQCLNVKKIDQHWNDMNIYQCRYVKNITYKVSQGIQNSTMVMVNHN
jgi:hypothetical protein